MNRQCVVLLVLFVAVPAWAYVEERYTLPRILNESTHIVVMQVERINKEKKLIIYKKLADLKGKHPTELIKHNVGVGGFNAFEQKAPIEWAEVGKIAIFFHNGSASETCIGNYWYQCYPGGEWWNHSHGEPYLCRSYKGDIQGLRDAIEKLLKGEDVLVPATVSRTDLRIQKVKASMKKPLDYIVVEPPSIERTKLLDVAGFSDMIELPRPEGRAQGAIAVDFDNDGYPDLLLVGTGGLKLLHNNQKGNFEDWTDKWGLSEDPGCRAAAFADYNRSGRLSLLTSAGRLYTNVGDKFRDDSKLLPATPPRVSNPGEAFAWVDINNDGWPDIICSLGVQGLTAYLNTGGKDGRWFDDQSDKVGLGPGGLGQEPGNFLTTLDLRGAGSADFVLNLDHPVVALNNKGVFKMADNFGLAYPALPRPALAAADYLNDGQLGLFVTSNERRGAIKDWQLLGTFSTEEDKRLPPAAQLNPQSHPLITMGDDRWQWRSIKARTNGAVEVGRRQPSPNAAYAFATFDWPTDARIVLNIGSENGVTAWLNGTEVYKFEGKRSYVPDTDGPEVDVRKGTNTLLLKVFDEGPVFRVSVRPAPKNLYPPPAAQLYRRDAAGKFTDVISQAGDLAQLRADCVTAIWTDLDGDGWQDLVVTTKSGLVRYYRNLGDGTFRYATADLGLEQKFKASGVIAADFNKDGTLDLVLLGEDPDPCVVLLSRLKGKRTPVTIRCTGPEPALGASIQIANLDGKVLSSRHLSGGDGRNLQVNTDARFALEPGTYRVRIRYSSGLVQTKDIVVGTTPLWETVAGRKAP